MLGPNLFSPVTRILIASLRSFMKVVYIVRSGKCPLCGSTNIHRSKRKGIAEQLACRFTPVRPFRCNDCDNRIYAFQRDAKKSAWDRLRTGRTCVLGVRGKNAGGALTVSDWDSADSNRRFGQGI